MPIDKLQIEFLPSDGSYVPSGDSSGGSGSLSSSDDDSSDQDSSPSPVRSE